MQLYYALANEPQNILLNGVSVSLTERDVTQGDVVAVSAILGISVDQAARMLRDRLLSASDWMALSDVTMSPAWAAYRQELRDITTQAGFPDNIVWPKEPVA